MTLKRFSLGLWLLAAPALIVSAPYWITAVLDAATFLLGAIMLVLGALVWLIVLAAEWIG